MTKSRLWALIAALALVIGTLGLAACGSDDDETTGSGGGETTAAAGADLGLQTDGTIAIGTDTPYPPFEFGKAPDYQGFDIDLMNAIAEGLGVETEYQDTAFDTIFTDLASGSFDAVISASTITPERQQQVDFSDPYYSADQAIVATSDSDVASVEDLADLNVAAQNGTTGLTFAQDETDAANVQGFPQGPDVINAVKAGQVDAGILDLPVAQDGVEKTSGIEVAATIPTGELYGIAIPKDNDALREAINEQLVTLKEDGTLEQLYQKYFGVAPPEDVLNGTTAPVG